MLMQALGDHMNSVATPGEKTLAIDQDATIGEDGNWENLVPDDEDSDSNDVINNVIPIFPRAVAFNDVPEVSFVDAYSEFFEMHPSTFVISTNGALKRLSPDANPYTGKSKRIMWHRRQNYFLPPPMLTTNDCMSLTSMLAGEMFGKWRTNVSL